MKIGIQRKNYFSMNVNRHNRFGSTCFNELKSELSSVHRGYSNHSCKNGTLHCRKVGNTQISSARTDKTFPDETKFSKY